MTDLRTFSMASSPKEIHVTKPMLELAVIGADGRQGRRRLDALTALQDCRLRWLVELPEKQEALNELARRVGCRAATDWRTVLRDPEVDAVIVCTPTDDHADVA